MKYTFLLPAYKARFSGAGECAVKFEMVAISSAKLVSLVTLTEH